MQNIPFTVGDDRIAFTTISPMLIAGESMTSEITLIKVPTEWEGYSYRMFITSPKKVKMDAIPITLNTPIPITNTMLDDRGSLIVEFGAYKDNTKVYRSRVTDSCKLRVHGSRSEEGTTSPDALPSVIAELSETKTAAITATTSANTAAQTANDAAADCMEAIEVATSVIAELSETKTAAITATTSANTAAQTANDAASDCRVAIETATSTAVGLCEDQVELASGHADDSSASALLAANNILNGVSAHNDDATAHPSLIQDIRTVEAIARGRATAYVFDTLSALNAWVAIPENVSQLVVGDNLYIRALNVKDRWWDGTQVQILESESPDLTNYYLKSQVDAMIPIIIGQAAYDALVAAGTVEAGRIYYVTGA